MDVESKEAVEELLADWEIEVSKLNRRYSDASDAVQKRILALIALAEVQGLVENLHPWAWPRALTDLETDLEHYAFGRCQGVLEAPTGVRPPQTEERIRADGYIAAAVKSLSLGGERNGRLRRSVACRLVCTMLNELGVRDRGKRFVSRRVENIYLQVVRSPTLRTDDDGILPTMSTELLRALYDAFNASHYKLAFERYERFLARGLSLDKLNKIIKQDLASLGNGI